MEEEFEEEEVWGVGRERKDDSSHKERKQKESSFSSEREQSGESTPVRIPNWPKIYKRSSSLNARDQEEEEEEEEKEMLPPHEWLARKMAKSQISSSSVVEGIGRTLKGKDQRKVRDAVLTGTGFLE